MPPVAGGRRDAGLRGPFRPAPCRMRCSAVC